MSEHTVISGELQLDREARLDALVDARAKQLLPEILGDPLSWDIDVDLMDEGYFGTFLVATFTNPDWRKHGFNCRHAMEGLYKAYVAYATKAAEREAERQVDSERFDGGYAG